LLFNFFLFLISYCRQQGISGISGAIASALQFNGPFNLHVIAKDDQIYVLECNPRCARSFPFMSKTLEVDLVALSTQVALGIQPHQYGYLSGVVDGRIGVRMPITSFVSLDGADSLLGVDMVSTGEVACFGETLHEAYLKAFLSVGFKVPKHNVYVSIGSYKGKAKLLDAIRIFHKAGINLYGSPSTADYYSEHGIGMQVVAMNHDETTSGDERSIRQFFIDGNFDLVINMPIESSSSLHATSFINEGYHLRRMAINHGVPLLTNYKSVRLLADALHACHFKEPLINTSLDCLTSVQWVKLPALIEVHVSLQDNKQNEKINAITCGTKMALAGGYTQVLITQQQKQPVVDMNQLQAVDQVYAQRSYCDYGFYASASRPHLAAVHDLEQHTLGLSIDQSESNTLSDLVGHFASWPADGLIVSNAECTSLAAVLFLAELYTRRVHITRVSTKDDIQLIKLAKQRGLRVTCDVAPHHLFLSADGANHGPLNLKSENDRLCLWDHMDYIDVISSDYSYTLEMTLTLMLTAYKQGKISMKAIVEKLHDNPKRIFNLPEQADTFIEAGQYLMTLWDGLSGGRYSLDYHFIFLLQKSILHGQYRTRCRLVVSRLLLVCKSMAKYIESHCMVKWPMSTVIFLPSPGLAEILPFTSRLSNKRHRCRTTTVLSRAMHQVCVCVFIHP
jgi:carbamoyl-phosphate synthase/aspartate carbamoyltransferase/dihydroorotase